MRLIDADELLQDPCFQDDSIPERFMFIDAVNSTPTYGEINRRAKWIQQNPYARPCCSLCRQTSWDDETDRLTPYCPKCGAKMDLDIKGDR